MTASSAGHGDPHDPPGRDVSVVIPTYNYGRFVARAVESALGQTLPPAQVVVVDDGSSDDTAEVLERFGSTIEVIRQANGGVASARNRGAASSRGSLLAFLDADDAWEPTKLEAQVACLEANPGAGLVHCGMKWVDEEGKVLSEQIVRGSGWLGRDLLLMRPVVTLGGSVPLIPRAVFEQVGGFDTRLSTSADWELCLRIALSFPVAALPEALVLYTVHSSSMRSDLRAMERDQRRGQDRAIAAHPDLEPLRQQARAALYMTLGGSYLASGRPVMAGAMVLKAVRRDPRQALHLLRYPRRQLGLRSRSAVLKASGGAT